MTTEKALNGAYLVVRGLQSLQTICIDHFNVASELLRLVHFEAAHSLSIDSIARVQIRLPRAEKPFCRSHGGLVLDLIECSTCVQHQA